MREQTITALISWRLPADYVVTDPGRCLIVCCLDGMRHGWWSGEALRPHFVAWAEMPSGPQDIAGVYWPSSRAPGWVEA